MRISDWSSDVCSSDHDLRAARVGIAGQSRALLPPLWPVLRRGVHLTLVPVTLVVMMAVFGFSPLKAAVWTVAVNVALYFIAEIVLAGERSAALRAGAALVAAHAVAYGLLFVLPSLWVAALYVGCILLVRSGEPTSELQSLMRISYA